MQTVIKHLPVEFRDETSGIENLKLHLAARRHRNQKYSWLVDFSIGFATATVLLGTLFFAINHHH